MDDISEGEFVRWFRENDFENCSVDRIDSKGHYTMDNIQLIDLKWNMAKDRYATDEDHGKCYRCGEIKPVAEFSVDNRRHFRKRATICKSCDKERKK